MTEIIPHEVITECIVEAFLTHYNRQPNDAENDYLQQILKLANMQGSPAKAIAYLYQVLESNDWSAYSPFTDSITYAIAYLEEIESDD